MVELVTWFYPVLIAVSTSYYAEASFLSNLIYKRTIRFRESEECSSGTAVNYAIIAHGWRESCDSPWVRNLTQNLNTHRGGCMICMDYRLFAKIPDYFILVRHFRSLSNVLANKLRELEGRGFNPDNGYMFGFSLGARIVLEAGRLYGKQKIAEIDICDMAGPGFRKQSQSDPKEAAKSVQCIHTSSDKGTKERNCHQNWNMGRCGEKQEAASNPPLGSHGLCPIFYNAAFTYNFYAEHIPRQCPRVSTMNVDIPLNYKMGYLERRKFYVTGNFYASTTRHYPFTHSIEFNLQRIPLLAYTAHHFIIFIDENRILLI